MIGYTCKYAPVELMQALGGQCVFIDKEIPESQGDSDVVRVRAIKYAREILSYCKSKGIDELIIPGCNDIAQRAFDMLKAGKDFKFLFFIDLPYMGDRAAIMKLKAELIRFMQEYTAYTGKDLLLEDFLRKFAFAFTGEQKITSEKCGTVRTLQLPGGNQTFDELMNWYAEELLHQTPCVRMGGSLDESEYVKEDTEKSMPEDIDEEEPESGEDQAPEDEPEVPPLDLENMTLYGGIDIGYSFTKAVVTDESGKVIASASVRTESDPALGVLKAFGQIHDSAGIDMDMLAAAAACGPGASAVSNVSDVYETQDCVVKAASGRVSGARTVVDLGAKGCRFYTLGRRGDTDMYAMNNDCVTASGKFLEMAADALEIEPEDLESIGRNWSEEINLRETCAVYAAEELKEMEKKEIPTSDIIRSAELLYTDVVLECTDGRFRVKSPVVLTGGAARYTSVCELIEQGLRTEVILYDRPEYCAAEGAAMFAAGL
ncbi:MAG: BadF/BadG/BcrA/BcrD ATPase family protein [Anaerovoracaceae bacterium]